MLPYTGNEKQVRYFKGQTTKSKAVGYCHNVKHKGLLSIKNMRKHECLRKQCTFFEKYEDHPHWEYKARIKAIKKARKEDMS